MSERALEIFRLRKAGDEQIPEAVKLPLLKAKEFALPLLRKGRPKYDVLHTFHVDFFARRIALSEGIDPLVMGTCAWLHDTGYYEGPNDHVIYSLRNADEFFHQKIAETETLPKNIYDCYFSPQIAQIYRIIEIHDTPNLVRTIDETAFMEADVLGAITTDTVKFQDFKEAAVYSSYKLLKKIEKFQTHEGKKLLLQYLPSFIKDVYRLL